MTIIVMCLFLFGVYYGSQFLGTVRHELKNMWWLALGKEGDEFWCSAWFLLFIQSKTPALGAPIFRVGLPASVTPV